MTKPAPSHPDVEIFETTTVAARHLRIDTLRFRHRLFSGEWSGERSYDVLRRGQAVAIVLYDPDRGAVVAPRLAHYGALTISLVFVSPWMNNLIRRVHSMLAQ